MVKNRVGKTVVYIGICIILLLASLLQTSAAGCEFTLSDVQVKKGRLFTVPLECKSDRKISAFIAEIEYDANALEYRTAAVVSKEATCSVNSTESGELRLVYLCESGADCKGAAPLIELNFKALKNGSYPLSLEISQVIDSNCADVNVNRSEGALVQAGAATATHSNSKREDSVKGEKSENASDVVESESTLGSEKEKVDVTSYTKVEGAEYDVILIVSSVMAVLTLLCLVGFCAYKAGVKRASKKDTNDIPTDCS